MKVGNSKDGSSLAFNRLLASETLPFASQSASNISISDQVRISAASIADKFRLYCETGSLPSAILNVAEYDRSSAELAGGSYTGDGSREILGQIVSDRNGNYIFRFRMSGAQVADEITTDTAAGKTAIFR